MNFLSYLINGISLGSVYAIIALGYTMVYGIAKMLNFAHGDVIMIGCYVVFLAMSGQGISPLPAVVLSIIVCTVLGIVVEKIAYKPLRRATPLAVLITAIGVSYFLLLNNAEYQKLDERKDPLLNQAERSFVLTDSNGTTYQVLVFAKNIF